MACACPHTSRRRFALGSRGAKRQKKTPDWGQTQFTLREVFARCAKIRTPSHGMQAPRSSGGETELSPRAAGQSSREALSPPRKCKKSRAIALLLLRGGEREIRNLVGVLAQTRFPVVRLRPAQPSLHIQFAVFNRTSILYHTFFYLSSNIFRFSYAFFRLFSDLT